MSFSSKKNLESREIIATYADTLLKLETVNDSFDELYSLLKTVVAHSGKHALIALILLSHGKDSVSIQENLQLESTEIKLVQRMCIDSHNILALIEELLFMITTVPSSEA